MKSNRIVMPAVMVGLVSLGVAILTAAKDGADPGKKEAASPPVPTGGKRLVCLGYVDGDEPLRKLFPDNFPQPSRVKEVKKFEGDHVRKDEPLLIIEDEALALKVKEANAAISIAEAEVDRAKDGLKVHESTLYAAKYELDAKGEELKSKKEELKEIQRLFDNRSKSQAEVLTAEAAVKAAEHSLNAAQWRLKAAEQQSPQPLLRAAEATVSRLKQLKAQAEYAQSQMACKAPADGRIVRSFVYDGMSFGPQSREPAYLFLKDQPMIVRAEIPQEFARRVKVGVGAKIEDEADGSAHWKGAVKSISDFYLPKRQGGGGGSEIIAVSDDRVLECIVTVELAKDSPPLRFGQKVRVILGD